MKVLLLTYAEVPDQDFDMTAVASMASVVKDLISSALDGCSGATCLRVGSDEVPTSELARSAYEGIGASMERASRGDMSVKVGLFTIGPTKES